MVPKDWFASVTPKLLRREDGGWLAISPKGAPLPLGVAAWTAEDARNAFAREIRAWKALLQEPARTA